VKRFEFIRSERSDEDLREIVEYLSLEASASVALHFIDSLEETYQLLQSCPEIGRVYVPAHSELSAVRAWRVHCFERYLLFYEVHDDAIRIARVLHGSQDLWVLLGLDD
jgi:toxin ParE1/3/4